MSFLGIGSQLAAAGTSALSAGASGLVSSLFGNSAAQEAYERQKELYQHRYQWAVDDLRKAGLNPALSYMNSAGAASSAPMAQFDTEGASGAMYQQAQAQLKAVESQTKLNSAQEANVNADTAYKDTLRENILFNQGIENKKLEQAERQLGIQEGKVNAEIAQMNANIYYLIEKGNYTATQREQVQQTMKLFPLVVKQMYASIASLQSQAASNYASAESSHALAGKYRMEASEIFRTMDLKVQNLIKQGKVLEAEEYLKTAQGVGQGIENYLHRKTLKSDEIEHKLRIIKGIVSYSAK